MNRIDDSDEIVHELPVAIRRDVGVITGAKEKEVLGL
jgi:hypothetical protein